MDYWDFIDEVCAAHPDGDCHETSYRYLGDRYAIALQELLSKIPGFHIDEKSVAITATSRIGLKTNCCEATIFAMQSLKGFSEVFDPSGRQAVIAQICDITNRRRGGVAWERNFHLIVKAITSLLSEQIAPAERMQALGLFIDIVQIVDIEKTTLALRFSGMVLKQCGTEQRLEALSTLSASAKADPDNAVAHFKQLFLDIKNNPQVTRATLQNFAPVTGG